MSNIDFTKALHCLDRAESILITCHIRPDGDALGSAAALAQILQTKGKSAEIILPSPLPSRYAFLFKQQTPRVIQDDWRQNPPTGFDTAVVLDTSVRAQLVPQFDFLCAGDLQLLVIDHHLSHEPLGTVNIIDPTASSVGLLVAELAQAWSVDLQFPTAEALFTAIATDTGWFKFPNADLRTFRQACQLIQAGVQPAKIHKTLYMQANPGRIRLLARALSTLELFCDGRLACMSLQQDDFVQAAAEPSDTEDFVNEPLRIESVEAAVMLTEMPEKGSVRISLRSKRQIDVAQLAKRFGGGGHSRAAGAQMPGPLSRAKQEVVAALTEEVSRSG